MKEKERAPVLAFGCLMRSGVCERNVVRVLPLLIVSALLAANCSDDKVNKPNETPAAIFPLAVGNKWIYDYTWGSDSVTASVVIDGKKYYVMRGSSLMVAGMPAYVRMNDQQQLLVRRQREPYGEHVLFDFGAESGSQWRYLPPFADTSFSCTVTLLSDSESTTVPAGEFKDCCQFYFDSRWIDGDWWFLIAPGTGIVRFGGGIGFDYKLVEFIRQHE